jgi:hypothetical protein
MEASDMLDVIHYYFEQDHRYASFEEAVTTYGNLVYQYKIRDNYINIEGSDSLPFNNAGITFVDSIDVNSPVTWSGPRLSTWKEIGFSPAYSQSIADGEIYTISASLSDFIALDSACSTSWRV